MCEDSFYVGKNVAIGTGLKYGLNSKGTNTYHLAVHISDFKNETI